MKYPLAVCRNDLHFDTFEVFQEWFEAHEDEAIDEGIDLQIAEVTEDFED